MASFGRAKIYTNYSEVNDDNIVGILRNAFAVHLGNAVQIEHLYAYYKGNQAILRREKKIRPDHNTKVVENICFEIANFIAGYLLAKPIQYVARSKDLDLNKLSLFNDYVMATPKESQDMKLAKDRSICGTGYRIGLPLDSDQPFKTYVLSPKSTFVVYSSGVGNEALLGCTYYTQKVDGVDHVIIEAYSKTTFYRFDNYTRLIIKTEAHTMGAIPIIEYPLNDERIGSFEIVELIQDTINLLDSDQANAITQFVQALMVFKNIEIKKEMLDMLKEMGAVQIKDNGEVEADIKYITQELNQTQVQAYKQYLKDTAYKIAGLPQQNSGGGGDNGIAVIYKDGWTEVEAKMRPNELAFKESEKQFLELVLSFTKTMTKSNVDISANQLEIKFTRSNYENVAQKVDAFSKMIALPNVAPILAYTTTGLFNDPEQACLLSEKYVASQPKEVNPNENTNQVE